MSILRLAASLGIILALVALYVRTQSTILSTGKWVIQNVGLQEEKPRDHLATLRANNTTNLATSPVQKNVHRNRRCAHDGKVFCIGIFKTGTTSCGRLLKDMGYTPVGKTKGYATFNSSALDYLTWDDELAAKTFTIELLNSHGDGQLGRDLNATLSANDSPWLFMFESLRKAFPNSRFIYTERDLRDLINSDIEHFWVGKSNASFPETVQTKKKKYGLDAISAQMAVTRRYRNHQARVQREFGDASKDLLRVNLSDKTHNWREHIERFLGCPLSGLPMLHQNAKKGAYEHRVSDDYWAFLQTYNDFDFANITKQSEPIHLVTNKSAHHMWIESGKSIYS